MVISVGMAGLVRVLIKDPVHNSWLPRASSVQIHPLEMLTLHHESRSWHLFPRGIRKGLVNVIYSVLIRSPGWQDQS